MKIAVTSTLAVLLLATSGCIFDTVGNSTSGRGGGALDAGTDPPPTVDDAGDPAKPDAVVFTDAAADAGASGWLPKSTPEEQGLDSQTLIELTERIRDLPDLPIFSLLISRKGTLVYELSHL